MLSQQPCNVLEPAVALSLKYVATEPQQNKKTSWTALPSEMGADKLFRNVGSKLPTYGA